MSEKLDNFLNILIPAVIFLLIFIFIYFKAKKPIDNFFSSFGKGEDDDESSDGISFVRLGGSE